jgi:Big-like domain-containing protein
VQPPTATNTVDQQHCVIATVTDSFGNAVPGVTVLFRVTGANARSGSAVTDANGRATFCYTGTFPGADTITATADANGNGVADATEPKGTATKTFVLPPSTCGEVEGKGSIVTPGGKGEFKFEAEADSPSRVEGKVRFHDTGAKKILVSTRLDSLVIVGSSHAEIFGRGRVNGGAEQVFRVDVDHTAADDTFRIHWAGYAAGGKVVKGEIEVESEACGDDDEDDEHEYEERGDGHKALTFPMGDRSAR